MEAEKIRNQAQETFNRAQEGIYHFVEKAKPVAEDLAKKSKQLYNDVREKLPENSEKYAAIAAAGLAVGFIAYQVGKNQGKSSTVVEKASEAASQAKENLKPVVNDFVTPGLKLVKLWMFYRLSL